MGRSSTRRRVSVVAALAVAALLAVACGSSSSGTSSVGTAKPPASSAASTGSTVKPATSTSSQPGSDSSAPASTNTDVKIEGEVPGTKAICAAMTGNSQLAALLGTNPSTVIYASGTVTNSMFGLNKVPGCQVGIDPTATNATIAWAICNYSDPMGFTDAGPIGGTSNVYNFAGTANGVIIILGKTTALGLLTGTAGSRSQAVLVTAIKDAAKLFAANGGCSSE